MLLDLLSEYHPHVISVLERGAEDEDLFALACDAVNNFGFVKKIPACAREKVIECLDASWAPYGPDYVKMSECCIAPTCFLFFQNDQARVASCRLLFTFKDFCRAVKNTHNGHHLHRGTEH